MKKTISTITSMLLMGSACLGSIAFAEQQPQPLNAQQVQSRVAQQLSAITRMYQFHNNLTQSGSVLPSHREVHHFLSKVDQLAGEQLEALNAQNHPADQHGVNANSHNFTITVNDCQKSLDELMAAELKQYTNLSGAQASMNNFAQKLLLDTSAMGVHYVDLESSSKECQYLTSESRAKLFLVNTYLRQAIQSYQ